MARNKKHIPNSLRKHRRLMGLSQIEIKQHLKLKSTGMISRWESGTTLPSSRNLLKLSLLYKTLVNELYYTLSKELQVELFPAETDIQKQRKKKAKSTVIRGP